jgi:hypothetical protein
MGIVASALALVLGAGLAAAGEPLAWDRPAVLAAALAAARPGDRLLLGPGQHRASLGRLAGLRIEGAGAGVTVLLAPEGEDGAVVVPGGEVVLAHLSLVAGPHRSALKVLGGQARLEDVALVGGAAGAFVDDGLLARRGQTSLTDLTASGRLAAVALLGGTLELIRATTTGPAAEAGVTVAGGVARLEAVVIRDPGPIGLAIASAEVTARDLTIAGSRAVAPGGPDGEPPLGDCVQVRRGTLRLASSELIRCGSVALEATRSEVALDGVDAGGGSAGGLIFTGKSRARLEAVLVTGHGPGLVLAEGATARAFAARFWTDPVRWLDCGSGAALEVVDAPPGARPPCPKSP